MTGSSAQGIKTVLHPVSDLATVTDPDGNAPALGVVATPSIGLPTTSMRDGRWLV